MRAAVNVRPICNSQEAFIHHSANNINHLPTPTRRRSARLALRIERPSEQLERGREHREERPDNHRGSEQVRTERRTRRAFPPRTAQPHALKRGALLENGARPYFLLQNNGMQGQGGAWHERPWGRLAVRTFPCDRYVGGDERDERERDEFDAARDDHLAAAGAGEPEERGSRQL